MPHRDPSQPRTQKQRDALGRATFHYIAPEANIRPTPREIRWLKHIERHGPLSSQHLYTLTSDTHSCRDTALRQMQKLRAGGFLTLPAQQRRTERAEFNPYVYDLTKKARDHLFDLGLEAPAIRPTGHWWHQYLTARVTSSLDITATRHGVKYIPGYEILALKGTSLAIPLDRTKLIPDQLFALDYGGSFRAFAMEVDRGTEPKTSPQARKSWARSIAQYRQVIEQGLPQRHYGLTAPFIILWGFTSRVKEECFLDLVSVKAGRAGAVMLTRVVAEHGPGAHGVWEELFEGVWRRAEGEEVRLAQW